MEQPIDRAVVRRVLGSLFGAQALYAAGTVGTFALMPIIVARMGANPLLVGLPSTMLLLGRALSAYPVGWLMDTAGRRVGLTAGYLFGGLGFFTALISIQQNWLWSFIGSALLLGLARTSADQSRYVAAEIVPIENRGKAMGTLLFANTLGAITGPLLLGPSNAAGQAYGLQEYAGPWLSSSVFGLLAAVAIFAFLHPEPNTLGVKSQGKSDEPPVPLGTLFASPRVQLAVLALIISQGVMTLIMVITPLSMAHNHHPVESVSLVVMAHTIGMWGLSNVSGWLIDRFGRLQMITFGGLLLVAASAIAPVSPEVPILAFALFLLGLGWNVSYLAGSSLFADSLGATGRGRAQGVSEAASSIASGAGSIGTGILFATGDILLVSAVGGVIASLLILAAIWTSWQGGRSLPASVASS